MTAQQHNQTDRSELQPLNMIFGEGRAWNDFRQAERPSTRTCTQPPIRRYYCTLSTYATHYISSTNHNLPPTSCLIPLPLTTLSGCLTLFHTHGYKTKTSFPLRLQL